MAGKNKNEKKKMKFETGTVASNRRARHDYEILETFEAGLMLTGTEVKSLRSGAVSLSDAYAGPKDGEMFLYNVHIGPYANAPRKLQHEPKRPRKVLLKKKEIDKLFGAVKRDGQTLIPLSLYFNDRGLLKMSIGLAKGKNTVDKRQTIKDRDWNRNKSRLLRDMN